MTRKEKAEKILHGGRGLRMVALILFIFIALASVTTLTLAVFQKQKELQYASSDSVIWTLSQLEVEYLKFSSALLDAETHPADPSKLRNLRQKFDILYSRLDTVANLRGLYKYESGLETRAIFGVIQNDLDQAIPYIDGSDADLTGGIEQLRAIDQRIASLVRSASLENLQNFVGISTIARETVLSTMQLLGAMTIGMMIALAITVLILFRLAGKNERIATEQRQLAARLQTILGSGRIDFRCAA